MTAEERAQIVSKIVGYVADYRENEIPRIDASRVVAWLEQFEKGDQSVILAETERILSKTYISRAKAKAVIEALVGNKKLAGEDVAEFWKSAGYLRLQRRSQSQLDMLALLDEVLAEKFKSTSASQDSVKKIYIYLDDVSFSGNQIKNDLLEWSKEKDIRDATVHVIVIGTYTYGEYYAKRELKKEFDARKIGLNFWAVRRLENSPGRIKDAAVLWPTRLPEEQYVKQWEATFAPATDYFKPRPPNGNASTTLFSSEQNRETLEQAFLKKGAYIFSLPKNPQASMRPLGFSALRTPGFGATLITYRNCPNNAPLVLWWGDPEGSAPLNQWTPLLQRRPRKPDPGADFDVIDI